VTLQEVRMTLAHPGKGLGTCDLQSAAGFTSHLHAGGALPESPEGACLSSA
jgi:hypothetical protein